MPTEQVNIRVDSDVKQRAQAVLKRQGLDISTAIKILLTKTANEGSIPLDITQGRDDLK